MTEQKNNSFLHNTRLMLAIIAAVAGISWGIAATVTSTQTQVISLKEQQKTFVSQDLFNAHLTLWDERFEIMEKQLTRIERLLLESRE